MSKEIKGTFEWTRPFVEKLKEIASQLTAETDNLVAQNPTGKESVWRREEAYADSDDLTKLLSALVKMDSDGYLPKEFVKSNTWINDEHTHVSLGCGVFTIECIVDGKRIIPKKFDRRSRTVH